MKIYLTTGVGFGKTPISAFDAALKDAGVYNFNLITLSSVIPPGSEIVFEKMPTKDSEWGNKLYCVKAEMRSRSSGRYIGAALGWYQVEGGKGVFVEHEETGETEESVKLSLEEEVKNSIKDLCEARGIEFDEEKLGSKINITQVKEQPASVLVVAAYKSEGWS
jgi:arginine decarboxylase